MDCSIVTMTILFLTALFIGVSLLPRRIMEASAFREMATFACPFCSRPFGLDAVLEGLDGPPGFGEARAVCRTIQCRHCGYCSTIRLNRRGSRYGPRLSFDNMEQIVALKALPAERVGELKAWLTEYKEGRAANNEPTT
jgi:hypothetical protein